MHKATLILLAIIFYLTITCCRNNKRQCFLSYPPNINYIGFDSSDFYQFEIEKYSKCCNFDTLIQIDTLTLLDLGPNWTGDTLFFRHLTYPSGAPKILNDSFNWIIRLPALQEIKLSRIQHDKNKCNIDPPGSYNACICNILDFQLETVNCSTLYKNGVVYVYK